MPAKWNIGFKSAEKEGLTTLNLSKGPFVSKCPFAPLVVILFLSTFASGLATLLKTKCPRKRGTSKMQMAEREGLTALIPRWGAHSHPNAHSLRSLTFCFYQLLQMGLQYS
jgi:hypothetical protein